MQQRRPHVLNFEPEAQRRPQSIDGVLTQTNQVFFFHLYGTANQLQLLPHHCHHSFAESVELESLKPVDDE